MGDRRSHKAGRSYRISDDDLSISSTENSPLLGKLPIAVPGAQGGAYDSLGPAFSTSAPVRSLIDPVFDEGDISSSCSSESSARRRDAAAGGVGRYESLDSGLNAQRVYREFKHPGSDELDDWFQVPEENKHKREEHATTDLQTFVHMMKGNIGTGLLALPLAVKDAGLILGVVGLLVMGIIATHCMLLLVKTSHELCRRRQAQALNYAEVAQFAVAEYTSRPIIPRIANYLINFFLIITQFGFCCVYFVFIGANLHQIMCRTANLDLGEKVWIAVILIPIILLCWISNLDSLSTTSMVANLCILFSLGVILYEEIYQLSGLSPDKRERAAIWTAGQIDYYAYKTLPLYFGSVVYAFEGIGMVLPLENKMKYPEHSGRVVVISMVSITILYAIFGGMGYITYGSEIEASITLNLLSLRVGACSVFIIVKLYYSFAVFASYALQFYVPMDFLEPPFIKLLRLDKLMYQFPRHHAKISTFVRLAFRTTLVIITAAFAMAIPNLDDLISLVGAFASSSLALIFPPLLEMLVFWRDTEHRWLGLPRPAWIIKDMLILTLGVVGFLFGTYASLKQIISSDSAEMKNFCGYGNCNFEE